VFIVCFLRATLPVETEGFVGLDRSRTSGASFDSLGYPCAGHQCGCRTREHCLAACCCFPKRTEVASEPRIAAFAARFDLSEHPTAFVQAMKCAGGAPHSVTTASTILSIEPESAGWSEFDASSRAEARAELGKVASRRPDPLTPPPRVVASCA
jgi:hypothetical protein